MKRLLFLTMMFNLFCTGNLFPQTVNVIIDQNSTTVCAGTTVTFKATMSGAEAPYTCKWIKNLGVVSERTEPTTKDTSLYVDMSLSDGDEISCEIAVNGSLFTSNKIKMVVNPAAHFGNDTTLFVGCSTDLINLNNVYDTAGYSLTWNTGNPAAADTGEYQLIASNANGCLDTAYILVKQEIAFWTGTVSDDWHTAANWSTGKIPDSLTTVIVQHGSPNACTVNTADAVAATLKVLQGVAVRVNNGHQVNITGNCSVLPITNNRWDGRYEVTGTMVDLFIAEFTGLFPIQFDLISRNATESTGYDPVYWKANMVPFLLNGNQVSGYGTFCPVFTFDPATNKITKVVNSYGQPAANSRSAELDPSGENNYDPVTKTIKVKFFMIQPSVIPTPPSIRVKFDWTMTWLMPR